MNSIYFYEQIQNWVPSAIFIAIMLDLAHEKLGINWLADVDAMRKLVVRQFTFL